MMGKQISLKYWLCWLAAPLLLFLPLLFIPHVMFFGNSDALFYSNILAMVSNSLKSGVLFPRWLPEANAGFGSPVMMFYAPLSYIVTVLINLPFASHIGIGVQLIVGMYASQVVSGYTCYLWLRRSFSDDIAFVGSMLFVLLPYKLIYIYLHINLAQLWALALLPLWMMAAQDIVSGSRRAMGAYALALAGVYYMHPLTLIAFGVVPAAYVLWFGRHNLLRSLLWLGIAHVLGLGMCMMQILPAHFYMPWIHSDLFLKGNYFWQNNFYHVDVVLCAYYGMIALVVGAAIRCVPSLKGSAVAYQGIFWIIVLCIVLFLTQQPSDFVWQMIKPLQYLQFPAARLHAAALMGVTYLICIWLSSYHEMKPLGDLVSRRATLVLLIIIFAVATGWRVYQVESDPTHASDSYLGDARAAKIISTPVPVYETSWGCIDAGHAYDLYEHRQVPLPITVVSGNAKLISSVWSPPDRIALNVDVKSCGAKLSVRQCYVPLWKAHEATGEDIAVFPGKANGLTELVLMQGRHEVELILDSPREEKLGRITAFIALIMSMILVGSGIRGPKRNLTTGA